MLELQGKFGTAKVFTDHVCCVFLRNMVKN